MKRSSHVPSLDALRGIAALLVVLHHLALTYIDMLHPAGLADRLTHPFRWVGHPAVIMFFVLSGFVLQISYSTAAGQQYGHYIIRRFFRIIPAMIASLLLAALLPHPLPGNEVGPWLNSVVALNHTALTWLRNALLFMARPDDMAFNPVLWSLAYEWRFSLIFPFLAFLCIRFPIAVALAVVPVFYAAHATLGAWGIGQPFQSAVDLPSAIVLTIFYMPTFLVGMLVALAYVRYPPNDRRLPVWAEIGGLMVSVLPYVVARNEVGLALSSAGIIAVLLYGATLPMILATRPFMWLGRISYSLYLFHLPLLLAFMVLWPTMALWTLPLTLLSSLLVADLSYRYIEKPFIVVGKRFGALVAGRRQPVSEAQPAA